MSEFRMPSLGADMEAGTLVEWRVAPGDRVQRGQVIALVDTDKATIEVEIWESGVIEELLIEPGRSVPVGTPLARLGEPEEAAGPPAAPRPPPALVRAEPLAPPPPSAGPAPPIEPPPRAELRPRRLEPAPAAIGLRTRAGAPPATPSPGARVRATPLARRVARVRGVDLARVHGSGPGGAILRADVEAAAGAPGPAARAIEPEPVRAAAADAGPAAAAAAPRSAPSDRTAGLRRAMAASMARSKREIPHFYLGTRIDLSRALAWLAAENARRPIAERILPAALLLRAVARAAREVPELNGFFEDGGFRPAPAVHLGVAVSLRGGGLIAPALHDADRKGVSEIMRDLTDLVQRARAGVLRSSELADATLTVTNLGDQGVESVFGVIHPPQVALLGFGRIGEQPWAQDGLLGVRPVLSVSLSADHRVSDGHRGARFLAALDRYLQEPETG